MVSLLCAPVGPVAPVGPFGPLGPIKIPVLPIFLGDLEVPVLPVFLGDLEIPVLLESGPVGPFPGVELVLRRFFFGFQCSYRF